MEIRKNTQLDGRWPHPRIFPTLEEFLCVGILGTFDFRSPELLTKQVLAAVVVALLFGRKM